MRLYLLYIIASISNLYLILFYWGLSAGFSNTLPIAALIGSALLFVVASPIVVFNVKAGALIGLLCCSVILFYNAFFLFGTITTGNHGNPAKYLFLLPALTNFFATMYSIYILFKEKSSVVHQFSSLTTKYFAAGTPIILSIIYLVFVLGKFRY